METALEGVRVLDLSENVAGPYCARIFAGFGAEVIKVERPMEGDAARSVAPFLDDEPGRERSGLFLYLNVNKKGITLDPATATGAALLRELVRDTDIIIESFSPGQMEKWGLGYPELQRLNPRLVCCSISGFGQSGPYSQLPSYDYIVQAMGGMMSITGSEESGPLKVGVAIADLATGLYCAIGILAALQERERSGEGQHLDIALLDSQISLLVNVASNYLVSGQIPKRYGNQHPNIVPYQTFRASDGEMVVAVGNDRQFQKLCQVLERPDLAEEPDYGTNTARLATGSG